MKPKLPPLDVVEDKATARSEESSIGRWVGHRVHIG